MKQWLIHTLDGCSYIASKKEVDIIAKKQITQYNGSDITSMTREDCDCCLSLMEKHIKPKDKIFN